MNIAIIGFGNVGKSLGQTLAAKGHTVRFGVRDADGVAEAARELGDRAAASDVRSAAAFGDAVILAVPWAAAIAAVESAGDLGGKVLIDCTNPIAWQGGGPAISPDVAGTSAAERIAARTAAHVVKAFSTHGAEHNTTPEIHGIQLDTYICGDHAQAKATVRRLAEDIGFRVVDAGPLRNAALLEHLAVLWVHLAIKGDLGRGFAFKALS